MRGPTSHLLWYESYDDDHDEEWPICVSLHYCKPRLEPNLFVISSMFRQQILSLDPVPDTGLLLLCKITCLYGNEKSRAGRERESCDIAVLINRQSLKTGDSFIFQPEKK